MHTGLKFRIMRVLLIEDDTILGESLKEYLESQGAEVKWISDDRYVDIDALCSFDVIVLDLMLKFGSGEDILKEIRTKGISTPVLILTAKSSIKDKEICFELGADDYLTKPFNPKELLLRLKALVRRQQPCHTIDINGAIVDTQSMIVKRGDKEYKLSKKAWELLLLLIRHRGKVLKTETILSSIWEDKPVGSEIVRAYIKELRKVLPEGAIETHKGIGYRLK